MKGGLPHLHLRLTMVCSIYYVTVNLHGIVLSHFITRYLEINIAINTTPNENANNTMYYLKVLKYHGIYKTKLNSGFF